MSDMVLSTPQTIKVVSDYDIIFDTGMMLPLTVDFSAGDTIVFGDRTIEINIVAKPSEVNPKETIPAVATTIFLGHVASIQKRTREIAELTPEAKHELQQTWQELYLHPTIQ